MRWVSALGAAAIAAAGCTYPSFDFGSGGAGGGSAASSSSGHTASSSSGPTASSSTSSTSSTSAGCPITHLLISEIRSRGLGGADDEFVELYNPTTTGVRVDVTWSLQARSTTANTYDIRWKGDNSIIPPHGHYLVGGAGYAQQPAANGQLGMGITDAGSLLLVQGTNEVDIVCYAYDIPSGTILLDPLNFYVCNGAPAVNPHDDNSDTNADASIERKPGGSSGNCTDNNDNFNDFAVQIPSTPDDLASPPQP